MNPYCWVGKGRVEFLIEDKDGNMVDIAKTSYKELVIENNSEMPTEDLRSYLEGVLEYSTLDEKGSPLICTYCGVVLTVHRVSEDVVKAVAVDYCGVSPIGTPLTSFCTPVRIIASLDELKQFMEDNPDLAVRVIPTVMDEYGLYRSLEETDL